MGSRTTEYATRRHLPYASLRHSSRAILAVTLTLAVLPGSALAATQKHILVLHSTRSDTELPILVDSTLPSTLSARLGTPVDYYAEYFDAARFQGPGIEDTFRSYLSKKYGARRFDLVIAVQDIAQTFVFNSRDLFGDAPVVFSTAGVTVQRRPNSAGVIAPRDLRPTLTLASALQPDLRQVFVVTGASVRDHIFEQLAREQFAAFAGHLTFTYLSGLPTAALERRVAALPEHSILYYVLAYRDGAGLDVNPLSYLERIAAVANRPTYSWVDSTLNRGALGGAVQQQARIVEAIGDLAARVLQGEPIDAIPLVRMEGTVNEVDWGQLRRWNINESRIPPGTIVVNRPDTVWQRHRVALLLSLGGVAVGALVLVATIGQRSRRSNRRIRDLSHHLLHAQEAERSRIAHDLHDDIGQQAAALSMHLERLNRLSRDQPAWRSTLEEALERTRDISDSARNLSHRLHPPLLSVAGIVAAFEEFADTFSTTGVTVNFWHHHVPRDVTPEIELNLFRIAQEALLNAVRHGHASRVEIMLEGTDHHLTLVVADNGAGFNVSASRGSGLGLLSIYERTLSLGGVSTIRSQPGSGTRLEVCVPVQPVSGMTAAS